VHATLPLLANTTFPAIRRTQLLILQVNLGYRCNQQCLHCHVNASPTRKEMMDADTVAEVLAFIHRSDIETVDLTGGAPELNPHFRELVQQARAAGRHVIDRCNLTILGEPGQQDLAEFLASHQVEVVASMPCYLEENVDAQRGKGVFQDSLAGLRQLNTLGYGKPGSGLALNLVYNPQGARLPPPQASLEQDYKKHMLEQYGIVFNNLFTLTNMPIQRFGSTLVSKGEFDNYLQLLKTSSCADNLSTVMCRSLISLDWRGRCYDCDFNQMLGLAMQDDSGRPLHISQLDAARLSGREISVADHCYGCIAGQGSSCAGALSG
jgi:radical SAM/Cys-rich protein